MSPLLGEMILDLILYSIEVIFPTEIEHDRRIENPLQP